MRNDKYRPRLIDKKIDEYLKAFGAVCVEGAKWCRSEERSCRERV